MHKLVYELVEGGFENPDLVWVVFADEASMMGLRNTAYLMEIMVAKFPNLVKIVLVGDVAQLESIEAGSVLVDLARYFPARFLTTNHRVSPESMIIHENSMKVREQNSNLSEDPNCFRFIEPSNIMYNDLEKALRIAGVHEWNSHIISPYRVEAKEINGLAKQLYTNKPFSNGIFSVGDKIMCTKNYHAFGLINGDFLKIVDILVMSLDGHPIQSIQTTSYRLLKGEFIRMMMVYAPSTEDEHKNIDKQTSFEVDSCNVPTNTFTLGYCTTNHKFQGCETDNLIFYMPKYTYFINWKHVYTAVTRARKRVILITGKSTLDKAITAKVYPRRSKLFMHLGTKNKGLDGLEGEQETPDQRLRGLLREMAVEGDEESTESGNKRENNGQQGGRF